MIDAIDWNWSKLLGRDDPAVTPECAAAAVRGKRVLITGAGGSIGSGLAESALRGAPEVLILADSSEYALYETDRRLDAKLNGGLVGRAAIVPVLGDILDRGPLREVLKQHRPNLIFHAAAYKHLSLLEHNPFAAIRNNALGTLTLAREVVELGGCDLILLSTDKAVEPQSIMGVSKRIAELVVLAHAGCGLQGGVVRLSNVLNSSGSVAPLFAQQLRQGHPLTVTHADARRFFITRNEASAALLQAASLGLAGRVMVPKSGRAVAVMDLARHMIARYESFVEIQGGVSRPTQISFVGLQPGEKLEERLTWASETLVQSEASGMNLFESPPTNLSELDPLISDLEKAVRAFDFQAMQAAVHALVPNYAKNKRESRINDRGFA